MKANVMMVGEFSENDRVDLDNIHGYTVVLACDADGAKAFARLILQDVAAVPQDRGELAESVLQACLDRVKDDGSCHFCAYPTKANDGVERHEANCPLAGTEAP